MLLDLKELIEKLNTTIDQLTSAFLDLWELKTKKIKFKKKYQKIMKKEVKKEVFGYLKRHKRHEGLKRDMSL